MTDVVLAQTTEVHNVPRHVRNLRHQLTVIDAPRPEAVRSPTAERSDDSDDECDGTHMSTVPTDVTEPHTRPPNDARSVRLDPPIQSDVSMESSEPKDGEVNEDETPTPATLRCGARGRREPDRYADVVTGHAIDELIEWHALCDLVLQNLGVM